MTEAPAEEKKETKAGILVPEGIKDQDVQA